MIQLVAFLFVSWSLLCNAELNVLHSVDGKSFTSAGYLTEDFNWERPQLSSDEVNALAELAKRDGFYHLRVHPKRTSSQYVSSSVRARCLFAGDKLEDRLHLTYDSDNNLQGITYKVPATSACDHVPTTAVIPLSYPTQVMAFFPSRAVEVRLQDLEVQANVAKMVLGADAGASVGTPGAAGFIGGGKPAGSGAPHQQAAATTTTGDGKTGAAPKVDDRSWLQKNWLFAVAIGMMLLNIMGRLTPDSPGGAAGPGAAPGGGGAPGGAARPAARAAPRR